MRLLLFILLTLCATPRASQAADAAGCADLKLFPRLAGCVIVECSAKRHDTFDGGEASGAPSDADTNALSYSCPLGDPRKLQRDFAAQLRKAAYQNIAEDNTDAASPALTARKGAQWIRWSAGNEDGASTYSLTTASGAGDKFQAEACARPPMFSPLKQCEVVECNSKSEDSVAMRTAQKEETALTGNVQTVTLACPSSSVVPAFSTAEGELKTSGFEILFSDREHPESAWITGRAGKRWVQLASTPDGESISYSLTLVPSAEVLTAAKHEPAPIPIPAPSPEPVEIAAAQPASPATPARPPAPVIAPTPLAAGAGPAPMAVFIAPKPILRIPIQATGDQIDSIRGDVVIDVLVDVSEDGSVTKAELTGKITKNVLLLKSAALDAISRWRFEPARQDGRIVAAVKIEVRMHFRGRPWLF